MLAATTTSTMIYVVIGGGGSIIGAYITIIGVYRWVARHMADSKKHPSTDEIVFEDVCIERGKANEQAHKYLKEGIEAAIARSDEQHIELKRDMKDGFSEIKKAIVQNGRK